MALSVEPDTQCAYSGQLDAARYGQCVCRRQASDHYPGAAPLLPPTMTSWPWSWRTNMPTSAPPWRGTAAECHHRRPGRAGVRRARRRRPGSIPRADSPISVPRRAVRGLFCQRFRIRGRLHGPLYFARPPDSISPGGPISSAALGAANPNSIAYATSHPTTVHRVLALEQVAREDPRQRVAVCPCCPMPGTIRARSSWRSPISDAPSRPRPARRIEPTRRCWR